MTNEINTDSPLNPPNSHFEQLAEHQALMHQQLIALIEQVQIQRDELQALKAQVATLQQES